jgi:polyphenol oxidase
MVVLESVLLRRFTEISFGFSTKVGPGDAPFHFNLSYSSGDKGENVKRNREMFFGRLGISRIAYQRQVHGDTIQYIDKDGYAGESDAMITDKPGIGLVISAADCTSLYIYDYAKHIIAGVHAGWRGTQKNIVEKTLTRLSDEYGCSPSTMAVYIAPSISCAVYEVDSEVASLFPGKYLQPKGSKYLLDVSGKNYDEIKEFGVPPENIQYSTLCTFIMKDIFHSYRRDGLVSGRSLGVIAIKEQDESRVI